MDVRVLSLARCMIWTVGEPLALANLPEPAAVTAFFKQALAPVGGGRAWPRHRFCSDGANPASIGQHQIAARRALQEPEAATDWGNVRTRKRPALGPDPPY